VSALHAGRAGTPGGRDHGNAASVPPDTEVPAAGLSAGPGKKPRLVAVAVVAGDGAPLLPCGRCRQLLLEAGGAALLVDTERGPLPLSDLLPAAFGGADLAARREPGGEP
jgi:hypothetical protein